MKIIKLILVIIISSYLFITFVFDALHISFKKHDLQYKIQLNHSIGLQNSSIVVSSGFNIGRVVDIKNIDDKSLITVSIDEKYKSLIRKNSLAYVFKRKLIGLTMIEIVPDFSSKQLKEFEILKGIASPRYNLLGSNVEELLVKFNSMLNDKKTVVFIKELDKLFKNIDYLKSKENKLTILKTKIERLKEKLRFTKKLNFNLDFNSIDLISKKIQKKYKNMQNEINKSKNNINLLKKSFNINVKNKKNDINLIVKNMEEIISKQKIIIDKSKKLIELTKNMGNISLFLGDKEIFDYAKFIIKVIKQEPYRFLDPYTTY